MSVATDFFFNGFSSEETLDGAISTFCDPLQDFYIVYVDQAATGKDYTVFDQNALAVSQALGAVVESSSDLDLGSVRAQVVLDILSETLGTTFCFGSSERCVSVSSDLNEESQFDFVRRLFEFFDGLFESTAPQERLSAREQIKADITQYVIECGLINSTNSFNSAKEAAIALHQCTQLVNYGNTVQYFPDLSKDPIKGLELWAVIDRITHAIKEVSTGFHPKSAVGIYKGSYIKGDSTWHSHPSGGRLHGKDYESMRIKDRYERYDDDWIFASGASFEGILVVPESTDPVFYDYCFGDGYRRYSSPIDYLNEVFNGISWSVSRKSEYKSNEYLSDSCKLD